MIQMQNTRSFPPKVDLFGVQMTLADYESATGAIIDAALERRPALVSCYAVHAVVTFSGDRQLQEVSRSFDMITPDGQPVRWAMNWLHRAGLKDRVYGPELMLCVCRKAAEKGIPIYLYGGTSDSLGLLESNLIEQFPGLEVAGSYSPPFRDLSSEEVDDVVRDINDSGAGIVFIGLGCPKQDVFALQIRDRIHAVQVCVGAAFDFHAGVKPMAPRWMQRAGLEWCFRLMSEPGRLWRRYLATNSIFLWRLFWATFFPSRKSGENRSSARTDS